MRIFIGCSTSHLCGVENGKPKKRESKNIKSEDSIASFLNAELNNLGYDVKAWWDENTMRNGEDFFRKLFDLSRNCDTGIFILNNESKIKSKEDNYSFLTNDNVLLELGMFISQKGINNVIFIADNGIKIPSDFSALNIKRYDLSIKTHSKKENLKNEILKHVLNRINAIHGDFPTDYINATVYFNYDTLEKILNKSRETQIWNSKSAYIGFKAARRWRNIELDPEYLPESFKYDFRTYLENIQVKLENIRNIISLGSGIGTLDEQVLKMIPYKGSIKYIPVEINPYLAVQSLHRGIRSIINLRSTYAIIDDFEDETSQLHDFIKNKIVRTEEESLYTLLGGTFCNIDNQHSFLLNWSEIIDSNDKMLIDIYVKNPGSDNRKSERIIWNKIINEEFGHIKVKKDFSKYDLYDVERDRKFRIKNDFVKPMIDSAIHHKFETSPLFAKSEKAQEYINLDWNNRIEKMYYDYVDIDTINTKNDSTLFVYRFKSFNETYDLSNILTLFKAKRHQLSKLKEKISKYFAIDDIYYTKINEDISRAYFLCSKRKVKKDKK